MADQTDNRRPEEIESDIERTRADFSDTIEAIQTKLTPSELKNQAVDYALNTTPGAFSANLVNTVRDNPIPVALIGVGIAWLMSATKKSSQRASHMRPRQSAADYPAIGDGYYDEGMDPYLSHTSADTSSEGMLDRAKSKAGEAASDLKHKASDVGHRLSDTASEATGRARQMRARARNKLQQSTDDARMRMQEVSHRSQMQYYRAKDRFNRLLDEQPIVVGALGIAVGAALGATLPSTRRENELMGRKRDQLLEKAKQTARQQANTVKQSAQRVAQTAKHEVDRVKEDVSNAASQEMDPALSRTGAAGSVGSTQLGSSMSEQQRPH